MALFKVAADKRYLVDSGGQPFFALGVNYAGYFDRAWQMWERDRFDPALITRDFRKAQNSGFNSIRLFVHTALEQDIRQGNFDKLDQVLSLAQDHDLRVMLTFNDSHSVNLARVSDLDVKIVQRYLDVPTIFCYDLQNEPVFYNLVAALYPPGYPAPVQTSRLIDGYGERVSRAETQELQRQRRVPLFLSADNAYYYINALRLFLEYDQAMNSFVRRGKGTIVDFMLSPEAEPWHEFIEVMDQTVDAWLRARIEPVRAAGCRHLLTTGWSWLHFSTLPANRILDFQQYHNYQNLSLSGFNTNVTHLQAMRQAFPGHPNIFGEFGWSNQTSSDPNTSRPVPPEQTALYEAATHAYLRANGFAGAFKWMLNDVDISHNPREASFGVFSVGDRPKPIRDLLARFGQDWPPPPQPATFWTVRDGDDGMAYRFNVPFKVTIGGRFYQDSALTWQTDGPPGHCFINITGGELLIDALGSGQLSIAPWHFLSGWDHARQANLYRVFGDNARTRQQTFDPGENVVVDIVPGAQYAIALGAEQPGEPPSDGLPLPEPGPGEHVVLLGDSEQYLPAALPYIRRFSPDFSFAAGEVAQRWAYVTVVATEAQISNEALDDIRGMGAQLVERVVGDSTAATEALLRDMAERGQRFLTAPLPPQTEPPTTPAPEPTEPRHETYVVQPGDTLSGIAKKLYGDYRLWSKIFEANQDQISNPSLIRVGMRLLIPSLAQ